MSDDLFSGGFNSSKVEEEIDLDRAASAFPEISLDGDIPNLPIQTSQSNQSNGFSFDDFDSSRGNEHVTVTGNDELNKFESQFPELEEVRSSPWPLFHYMGYDAIMQTLASSLLQAPSLFHNPFVFSSLDFLTAFTHDLIDRWPLHLHRSRPHSKPSLPSPKSLPHPF